MNKSLDFLHIHTLVHRAQAPIFPSLDRRQYALEALALMDQYQVLHPASTLILKILQENSESEDPLLLKYGSDWAASIRDHQISIRLELHNESDTEMDKTEALEKLLKKFKLLYIQGDFQDLIYHINKIGLVSEILINCTDHEQFIENRFFEFMFYHLAAIVYGQLWFSSFSVLEEAAKLASGPAGAGIKSWQQLEKSALTYHSRKQFLFKSLSDKRKELVDGVNQELEYFGLIRWLCAFAKFKGNQLVDYVADFDSLIDQLKLLDLINMRQEAILMYQVANITTKPFCELVSCESESLLDLYSGASKVEQSMYSILCKLAEADFPGAKREYSVEHQELLNAHIGFALPRKLAGCFWKYLGTIVDLKVFLLIMSSALKISRNKVLDKMGYGSAPEKQREEVSTRLVMINSALGLGRVNISYNQEKDLFQRALVTDKQKHEQLVEVLDDIDHMIEAETVAQLIKTRLVEKIFI